MPRMAGVGRERGRVRRRAPRPLAVGAALALAVACGGASVDITQALQVTDVTTGWFDAGIVEGKKNKLVPTISFRLKNAAPIDIDTVQINGVFRRVGEEDEWGSAFVRAIGSDGLAPGSSTSPVVLRSHLGYTGEQPRVEMLQHSEFRDARVELFVKHGSAQWVKLTELRIERQLVTE